ncbi:gamma-tubulin complex component 2 homolog [Drosophila santomea]|uniref:gamma-tubulin complex component 2 homolog n=1 Tax=Drosophila santomea TaxID=129105 RepID=UPI001954CC86|nr:gamma-tubulin complex component 2 homolog [Drosophila santomea]
MNPDKAESDFANKVRFHLSKDELERQMRRIHDRDDSVDGKNRSAGSGSSGHSRITNSSTGLPRQESWIFESVGGYFLANEDLARMSVPRQEQLLMRDLIYSFSGVPSAYVKPDIQIDQISEMSSVDIAKVRFRLDEAFNGAFRALANEVLPMIGYYISVQSYIEETNMTPNCGRTRLALASALGNQLQEYYDLQAKLETDLQEKKLNLKELVRQVRPWLPILKSFSSMACSARGNLTSAQVLTLLDQTYRDQKDTDVDLKERVAIVLASVSRTYMKIVQLWMQKGVLFDTQHEFFVEDTEPSTSMSSTLLAPEKCCHAYWAERYRLMPDRLPGFLLSLANDVFLAGKYLNILRQCNVSMTLLQLPLAYNPSDLEHEEIIKNSYELPAQKLLKVLAEEHNLLLHIRNLKSYFLLQEEGFSETLLYKCQEYLKYNVDRLIPEKLQTLLTETLQKSNDFFKDMLRCQLKDCDVATQLERHHKAQRAEEEQEKESSSEEDPPEVLNLYGYEALAFRYEAKWPLSFVLYPELLDQLQMLQRVLLFLHYVKHHLTVLWRSPSEGTGLKLTNQSAELRHRMLLCMLSLEHHITQDIAEPRWQSLTLTVDKAKSIDEVVNKLETTVEECLRLGLLPSANTFVKSLYTLGHVCLNFCDFVESSMGEKSTKELEQEMCEYEKEFNSFLASILELVSQLAKTKDFGERDSCKRLLKRLEEFVKFSEADKDHSSNT